MWLIVLALSLAAAPDRAADSAAEMERAVFDGVNRQRVRIGLPALAWDERAAAVARAHSARMRDADFFAHRDPRFGALDRRLARAGIPWSAIAENIYMARGHRRPAVSAVAGWMSSPSHRINVVERIYTRTGVGVATARDGTYWFTQIYLRP